MDKFKVGDVVTPNQHLNFIDGTQHCIGEFIYVTSYNVYYFNIYPERYTKIKKIPWINKNGKFQVSSVEMIEKYLQHKTGKKFSVARHGSSLVVNTVLKGELYTTKIHARYLYTVSETDFAQIITELSNDSKNPV